MSFNPFLYLSRLCSYSRTLTNKVYKGAYGAINQQKTFLSISFSEFCDRFSYYGVSSLLVLYLIHYFHIPIKSSYTVYAAYSALTFACCIVGGVIADKFMTNYQAIVLGILFSLVGNATLWVSTGMQGIYLGLSLIVVAVGLIKPSTSCILALSYEGKPTTVKDKAFTIFYMLASIGSVVGPLAYGIGMAVHNYRLGFLMCFVVLVLNLAMLIMLRRKLSVLGHNNKSSTLTASASAVLLLVGVYLVMSSIIPIEVLVIPAVVLCGYYLFKIYANAHTPQVKYFIKLMYFPMFISVVFFGLYLQLYSSVTIFILHDVNTTVWGFNIPITWLTSIEPLFIIVMAPLLAVLLAKLEKRGLVLSPLNKIFAGIVTTSITFFLLALAAHVNDPHTHSALVPYVVANIFLAISELFTIPVSLLWISANAPPNFKSILTGVYYFSIALSGVLSGIIAKAGPAKTASDQTFAVFFLYIAIGALVFGVLMMLPRLFIKKVA